ncbi:MAG TPA: molybdate ABC transporter substrate-binding protein [Gemmataceae bacterium]|nr:molybdate ABC transporter substrate-binding protein [Gemmataceae bacterium]
MRQSLVIFGLLFGLAGCASKPPGVRIFAAVSTREAVERITRDFESQSGTAVTCSFAASSTLARQIEQGADADLFLSADERWADYLADKGLVAQRCDLLGNRLVVVTPIRRAGKPDLHTVADLAGGEVSRLALALDPVPAGHYAREVLEKAGIWEQVKGRVREAGDVRATLALVERDEADAGIVYATDAATSSQVRIALEVPEDLHAPIRYPLVLLRRDGPPAARALYDFLSGETAATHFRKAGFQVMSETKN